MAAIDPTLVAEWSARAPSPAEDGSTCWRRAAQALLAERAEARALLADARWLVAETTYLAAGVDDGVHAQAVELADRLSGFLDPPHPTPAELDAALRAEAEQARG